MNRSKVGMAAVAAVFLSSVTVLAETLESVEKTIIEKMGSYQSYRAKITSTQNMQNAQMKLDTQSDMTYECLKKGDLWLYRTEGKTKTASVIGGQEQKQDTTMLIVYDGKFVWTLTETDGQKNVMKAPPSAGFSPLMDKTYFENQHKDYELKLLPDETVDGKATWPVQATPRQAVAEGGAATMITYFDKETGISVKSVGKDSGGKVILTTVTSDVKVNAPLAAERFVFKAPEGVPVMDLSQQSTGETKPGEAAKPTEPDQKKPTGDKKP
jgi:outer membrane lipoprotein-sorting protein